MFEWATPHTKVAYFHYRESHSNISCDELDGVHLLETESNSSDLVSLCCFGSLPRWDYVALATSEMMCWIWTMHRRYERRGCIREFPIHEQQADLASPNCQDHRLLHQENHFGSVYTRFDAFRCKFFKITWLKKICIRMDYNVHDRNKHCIRALKRISLTPKKGHLGELTNTTIIR